MYICMLYYRRVARINWWFRGVFKTSTTAAAKADSCLKFTFFSCTSSDVSTDPHVKLVTLCLAFHIVVQPNTCTGMYKYQISWNNPTIDLLYDLSFLFLFLPLPAFLFLEFLFLGSCSKFDDLLERFPFQAMCYCHLHRRKTSCKGSFRYLTRRNSAIVGMFPDTVATVASLQMSVCLCAHPAVSPCLLVPTCVCKVVNCVWLLCVIVCMC